MTSEPHTDHSSKAETEVRLPNGSMLRRGGRVRVPADLIWHPEVQAHAERLGWDLGKEHSPGSEVLTWPATDEEEAR